MNWIKKAVFLAIPSFVFLLIVEFGLRFFFPVMDPFVLQAMPNMHLTLSSNGTMLPGISGTTTLTTDHLGFRTSHSIFYLQKPKDVIRIFFIGGSTTEQMYVDDSKQFVATIEKKLNQHLQEIGSSKRVEAINTGRSGLHSVDHFLMAEELKKYQPDYLVFLMGINDLNTEIATRGDASNLKHYFASRYHESKRYIATRSHLVRLVFYMKAVVKGLLSGEVADARALKYNNRREKRATNPLIPLEEDLKDVPEFYRENVKMISEFLEQNRIRGVFLTQPTMWFAEMPDELDRLLWITPSNADVRYATAELDPLMERYNDVLRSTAEMSSQIELVDLALLLPKDTTVFYDDAHFNDAGAEKISNILTAFFEQQF